MKKSVLRKTKETGIQLKEKVINQGVDPSPIKAHDVRNGSFSVFGALLLIALFLTLNEFIFHFENLPTWSKMFSPDYIEQIQQGNIEVHFIDVGQGDCELIITENKCVLIDSGEREFAGTVTDYLKSLGVRKLDYIICSHPHSDHIGSMSMIINEFEADYLLLPKIQKNTKPETGTYDELINSCKKNDVNIIYVNNKSDDILLENNCYIDLIAPAGDYEDLNNYSIVAKLYHGENTFLFTGDIEVSAEYDISEMDVDISSDVIKVPHHGSSTSSSYRFLKLVRPQYAVIEVGADNDYNHPVKSILNRYKEFGTDIFRTDIDGTIVFLSDGRLLYVK